MKRIARTFALVVTIAAVASAQRHKLTINTETPEGQLLQAIGSENDSAKKLELMDKFMSQYGKHEAAPWVLSQMQAEYMKTGNFDKAIAAGETLLATDPDDLETAYTNLKAAEKKKDADAVIRWSGVTSAASRKAASAPKPADSDEETWKKSVDYARQVDTYTEYALSASALQIGDPSKIIALGDALEQRNNQSQYMQMMLGNYAAAARQTKQMDKAAALGERALERNQANTDMLLLMTEHALNKQQFGKAQQHSQRIAQMLAGEKKPDGVSDADWERRKDATLGAAYWFEGVALASESKFAPADRALRNALPHVRDNPYLLAGATFYLGLANYKLAQASKNDTLIVDALKYSRESAALKSPWQAQAAKNVKVIQTEYRVK